MAKHKSVHVVVGLTGVPFKWDTTTLTEHLQRRFKDRKAVRGSRLVKVEEPEKKDGNWEVVVAFPQGYRSKSAVRVAKAIAAATDGIAVSMMEA